MLHYFTGSNYIPIFLDRKLSSSCQKKDYLSNSKHGSLVRIVSIISKIYVQLAGLDKMVISLQGGQNFSPAGQISLQCGMVSLMYGISLFFPLQITKFPGKELPVLPPPLLFRPVYSIYSLTDLVAVKFR